MATCRCADNNTMGPSLDFVRKTIHNGTMDLAVDQVIHWF